MSLSSAALMLYCAYVTIIEPKYFGSSESSPSNAKKSSTSSTSPKLEDTRPLFQQRYFRDSASWKLPNTWAVKEDPNLAKYRFANHWSTLRPNVYFGMKSQPVGLSNSVQGGLATGLLWMKTATNFLVGGDVLKVRHDTANDEMTRLEWVRHDGANYGVQRLRDPTVVGGDLYTSFISSEHDISNGKNEVAIEWMQMLQTLSYDAPAPTTTSFRVEDAQEWEKKAYQDVRPVTTMFYLGVDCAEEEQTSRLQECREQLQLRDLKWSQLAPAHFQLTGRTESEGYFTLDIVLESSITKETSFEFKAAVSEELDLLHGTKQLLKELREPNSFSNNARRNQQQSSANSNRVFVDDFGEWQGIEVSEEVTDSLFVAFKFTLPPGQRLIFHYRSSPASVPESVSSGDIVNSWTEKSYASYQSFEERFSHLMRDSKQLSEEKDGAMNDAEMDAILTNVFGDAEETTASGNKSEDGEEKVLFQADDVEAIKIALSSLLGGMGTFMGQATISPEIVDTVEAHRSHAALNMTPGRMTLTTATPSRTVFPRGFLWDEGFHQLVIASWAPKLTLQTLADWLHAMYLAPHHSLLLTPSTSEKDAALLAEAAEEYLGWIPREMILGVDARQRVPAEFIPQRVDIANPPTFFLVLKRLIRDTWKRQNADDSHSVGEQSLSASQLHGFFLDTYPRLHAWVQWFLFTQAGDTYGTFRWRGRSLQDNKYIPNTLSSGLDDYPRAVVPDVTEKHVDLHAWMILACETMEDIHSFVYNLQSTKSAEKEDERWTKMQMLHSRGQYAAYGEYLRATLQTHHWSTPDDQLSLSYTVHTHENIPKDANPTSSPEQKSISIHLPLSGGYFDVGLTNETARFVLDVLCRCVNHNQKSAANILDMYIPMSTLHEFFHIQQIRQQLHQQYQQLQKKNKNAEPPELPPLPEVCPSSHAQFLGPLPGDGVHGLKTKERLDATQLTSGFVPRIGYVTLFPLLLQTIDPSDSEKLTQTLHFMEKPVKNDDVRELFLWTDYGLRSMGAVDVYYQRRNAPGDAPYWRGPIWININYLALSSLHHYANHPKTAPEVQAQCHRLYRQLRNAVLTTVMRNFHETGFFWEQYEDHSGKGIRGHPFTGWTATIVNIFTENY